MKKALIIIIFLFGSLSAKSDVIYFPYQYTLVSYSVEFIYSAEWVKKLKSSNVFWAGTGIVGSFFYMKKPTAGVEVAYERRFYFKPDLYNHFFISGYLGAAYMTNFKNINDVGIVPGFKLNYKAQLKKNLVLEPYVGLSLPVTVGYLPFPVATVGLRLGICKLKKRNKLK